MEKAVARRLDWTPVKPSHDALATPESEKQDVGFSKDLLNSYVFTTSVASGTTKIPTKVNEDGEQLKRKRIDLFMASETKPSSSTSNHAIKEKTKTGGKVKGKAPAKKALTITGLATSAYGEAREKEGKLPPMLEYLSATQAAMGEDTGSGIDVSLKKLTKSKAPSKKTGKAKKAPAKSRLLSPTSAIKTALEQPFLFGAASQLARDESPTLTRDTLEALERSECFESDPISPLRTQPISIESTSPRVLRGTNRLVKRRNLWGAAGRDEENALLHVDTVDLTDSPAVRQAFAGKDVLLQPGEHNNRHLASIDYSSTSLASVQTPHVKNIGSLTDIDDIVTPGLPKTMKPPTHTQTKAFHTSRTLEEPRKQLDVQAQSDATHSAPVQAEVESAPPKPKPVIPCYEGWSDHELKKQISAYGFKAIKKREKMVELLERCWKSQNGIDPDDDENDASKAAMTHGDFLSKVHDVSSRTIPKVKKPRAKRKSDSGETPTAKEPKKRRKAAAKEDDSTKKEKKLPRKRATKKVLSEEKVMDVDDIDVSSIGAPMEKHRVSVKPTINLNEKVPGSRLSERPATPPPTMPQLDFSSSPAFDNIRLVGAKATSELALPNVPDSVLTPKQTPSPDIAAQIYAAIHYSPKIRTKDQDSRNHQTSPTWREKILMYDPIVLEELTVWLNTEGFAAIGEDREVSPLEVRSWCEQNGVCCYGVGGGWRGRGRRVEE